MTEADSKYLATSIGLCWHEPKWGYWDNCKDGKYGVPCKYCGIRLYDPSGNDEVENIYFTSEHGFFVCFEWAKTQPWWRQFLSRYIEGKKDQFSGKEWWDKGNHYFDMPIELIGPRFAEELVEFLKSRE